MVTPVSTQNNYSVILADLMSAQNQELTAQQQVSTGKKGDDLTAFGDQTSSLVATNTVKARVDGMVSQLTNLQVKLNFQQSALGQVSDVAANLKQTLTNALANGQGDGIMTDVDSYFSQAVQALNTQYGGDYLFSGGQTQTQPFTATDISQLTATPPASNPAVSSFFQNGTLAPTNRIDDQTTISTGFLASDVGQQLMQVFQDIQSYQQANGPFTGQLTQAQQTFLQGEITSVGGVVDSTTQTTAQGGDIQKRVEDATTAQTDRQTTLKNVLGDITDVNTAQAASDLTQAQNALQASAQVFLTLKGMSLLNYLAPTSTS
ncbi:MAG TPA: flagellin [Caulobacteraceae bacterium]|jgi:flagellar hook-associated protein 3 FlgL